MAISNSPFGVITRYQFLSQLDCLVSHHWSRITESINRFNFYGTNIPRKARLSGATVNSASDSEIHETYHNVNGPSSMLMTVGGGRRQSQRDEFLDVSRKLLEKALSALIAGGCSTGLGCEGILLLHLSWS